MSAGTRLLLHKSLAAIVLVAALAGARAAAQTRPPALDSTSGLRAGADAIVPQPFAPAQDDAASSDDSTTRSDARPPARRTPDKKRADPTRVTKAPPGKLPALRPYKGAQRLGLRGGPPDLDPLATPSPSIAAQPTPPLRRTIKPDLEPFAPLGERIGDLKLTPYVEQDIGYASNPLGSSIRPRPSAFDTTEVGLGLQSDWSRSDLHGSLKAGYNDYFSTPQANAPYGSGVIDGRYDISRASSLDAEVRFSDTSETSSNLGFAGANNATLTQVTTYGATAGGMQKFGDFTLGLHGTYDRTAYGGGSASLLGTDDYNDFGLKLRASYRWSEAVSPFLEFDADRRIYDSAVDGNGYNRASDGGAVLTGLTLAFSQMLNGEISIGYGAREYRDPRLPNVAAPLINASLIWAITPLTTATFKTQSSLQDAVIPGASADINRSYTIEVDHDLTRQVRLGVTGAYTTEKYVGVPQTDRSYSLGATAEYHLSRELVVKGSAIHSQFSSNAANSSYAADVFMLGLRLQR